MDSAERMTTIQLNSNEKRLFAESAHALRFNDESETSQALSADKLLSPRRKEDIKDDLFTIFNVVQENLVKGGH